MKWINEFIKSDRGAIVALVAAGMVVILLCAALAADVGSLLTARNQLQAAVDAAALAGASGLLLNQNVAVQRAMFFGGQNTVHNQPASIGSGDISFPTSYRIRVTGRHTIPAYFMRIIGIHQLNITAVAAAELGNVIGTRDLRPWGVPHFDYGIGELVSVKIGDPNDPDNLTGSGFFYPVDYPPLNSGSPITGGSEYEHNIYNGTESMVYIDDVLLIEPGNMVGPTSQGVRDLIAEDPNAYWNGSQVVNSDYNGFGSPRIVKVPLWDPRYPPEPGRNTVTVVGLAAFFLEGVQGRDVFGRFIEITTPGTGGNGYSTLFKVWLIE
ncbi:hypothetical protein JXO59_02920 [candidate division KSB1 bacterium]|nr:hypothetical protein [candidate division KSB1 bacterium]